MKIRHGEGDLDAFVHFGLRCTSNRAVSAFSPRIPVFIKVRVRQFENYSHSHKCGNQAVANGLPCPCGELMHCGIVDTTAASG